MRVPDVAELIIGRISRDPLAHPSYDCCNELVFVMAGLVPAIHVFLA
jgi:hypothetical protein